MELLSAESICGKFMSLGEIYRNADVYISGAQHTPTSPNEMMHRQIENRVKNLKMHKLIEKGTLR